MAPGPGRKLLVILGILLLSGIPRSWVERNLVRELRSQGFHPENPEAELSDRVGVQGAIGMLGGMRYMVATFLELEAYTMWEPPPEWERLSETYQMINLLQPRNVGSWDDAAWHHIYNASGYYREQEDMPSLQREALARDYEERGVKILQNGIRWNPEAFELYLKLAHAHRYKFRDQCAAAEVYLAASRLEDAPSFCYRFYGYSLARCPGREEDAYRVLTEVYEEGLSVLRRGGPMIWKPTLIVELNRLARELDIPLSDRIPERFDETSFQIATPLRPEKSYPLYRNVYQRLKENDELDQDPLLVPLLKELEQKLGVPEGDRVSDESGDSGKTIGTSGGREQFEIATS